MPDAPPKSEKEGLNINICPNGGVVHVAIAREKEVIIEFDLDPYNALSILTSLQDAAIIARVNGMQAAHKSRD